MTEKISALPVGDIAKSDDGGPLDNDSREANAGRLSMFIMDIAQNVSVSAFETDHEAYVPVVMCVCIDKRLSAPVAAQFALGVAPNPELAAIVRQIATAIEEEQTVQFESSFPTAGTLQ